MVAVIIVLLLFAVRLVRISIREAIAGAKPNLTININQTEKTEISEPVQTILEKFLASNIQELRQHGERKRLRRGRARKTKKPERVTYNS